MHAIKNTQVLIELLLKVSNQLNLIPSYFPAHGEFEYLIVSVAHKVCVT